MAYKFQMEIFPGSVIVAELISVSRVQKVNFGGRGQVSLGKKH